MHWGRPSIQISSGPLAALLRRDDISHGQSHQFPRRQLRPGQVDDHFRAGAAGSRLNVLILSAVGLVSRFDVAPELTASFPSSSLTASKGIPRFMIPHVSSIEISKLASRIASPAAMTWTRPADHALDLSRTQRQITQTRPTLSRKPPIARSVNPRREPQLDFREPPPEDVGRWSRPPPEGGR